MITRTLSFMFILFSPFVTLHADETIDLSNSERRWTTEMSVEQTQNWAEQQWGLMGRRTLPPDYGMLFTFCPARQLHFWMFNCHMDLAVAFLDEDKVIREIHQMRAYPEMMDPERPVETLRDMLKYPPGDPTVEFFLERAAKSTTSYPYALETAFDWFTAHDVTPSDVLLLDDAGADRAWIVHTLDISGYKPAPGEVITIKLPSVKAYAVSMPRADDSRRISFLSQSGENLVESTLRGGAELVDVPPPVLRCNTPAHCCTITLATPIER